MKELDLLKKPFFWLFLAGFLIVSVFNSWPAESLKVVFCNVGQGDASLIIRGRTQILIDGGPNRRVLDCLSAHLPFWDREIEMVILTHPEDDHFTGLIDVIKRYDIKQFVINPVINDSPSFWEFHRSVLEEKASVYFPVKGDRIAIGPLSLKFLWPEEKLGEEKVWLSASEEKGQLAVGPTAKKAFLPSVLGIKDYAGRINETSAVIKLNFYNFCVFFPADISSVTEGRLEALGQCDILKVGHHGSKFSTGEELLVALRPALAVISVGKNSYGHPATDTLGRLERWGIKTLRTDEDGEIVVTTDGLTWRAPREN